MDYHKIVKDIIKHVGNEENINFHSACMTRLRISVLDLSLVNLDALKQVEGALGLNTNDNEIQVIFGPGKVTKAKTAMDEARQVNMSPINLSDDFTEVISNTKKKVIASRNQKISAFMSKFGNIFVPLIPGFIAAGIFAGFADLFRELDVFPVFTSYMAVFATAMFAFYYILVGYNASNVFGGTGVIGAMLSSLFLLQYGSGDYITGGKISSGIDTLFGVTIDPRGGMIGVLITAIIAAKVENLIRKRFSWDSTDIITTPVLTLLVMGVFTFFVVMPISEVLFDTIGIVFNGLNKNPLGAALIAGTYLPSVMMGIHQGFIPIYEQLFETTHMNSLYAIQAMAGAAQVGTAIALFVKAKKNSNIRRNIRGAIVPGFLGIGEPLIYGVTLPRVKPFLTAMAGGAVGGFYLGTLAMLGLPIGLSSVYGNSGILGVFSMTSYDGVITGILIYLSGLIVSYIAGYFITFYFGTKNIDLE